MAKQYISNTVTALTGLHIFNTLVDVHTKKMSERQRISGEYFDSKNGKVFYRVKGHGNPVLLIHNLGHRSASYEWDDIIHYIAKNNKVYCIDLPGCGRSDKPKFIYTSFLYVQLIREFTKRVIKDTPAVIVSGDSIPFTLMAESMYPGLFSKTLLINAKPIKSTPLETDTIKMAYMKLLFLPIVGTSFYNVENFFYNFLRRVPLKRKLSENALDHSKNAFISAHLQGGNGRFLRASKINNFTTVNISDRIGNLENIHLIMSTGLDYSDNSISSFKKYNPGINIIELKSSGEFPHMDMPGKTYHIISSIL